jgi:hypothetical protein
VANQSWDVSVKSLVAFPQVLEPMSDQLDWTKKLGDAVLAQQKDVLAAVQRLRAKAQDSGNLKTTEQQTVVVEQAETKIIRIEPTNPQVIYVPAYEPAVVYGGWYYPAYPPYYWPPYPAYYPGYAFGAGLRLGPRPPAGAIFGNCNWGGGDINIDINRATNIDRLRPQQGSGRQVDHDSSHRQGVSYRDNATREKFGKGGRRRPAQRIPRSRRRGRSCRYQRSPRRRDRAGAGDRAERPTQPCRQSRRGSGTWAGGGGRSRQRFNDVNRGGGAAQRNVDRGRGSMARAPAEGGAWAAAVAAAVARRWRRR